MKIDCRGKFEELALINCKPYDVAHQIFEQIKFTLNNRHTHYKLYSYSTAFVVPLFKYANRRDSVIAIKQFNLNSVSLRYIGNYYQWIRGFYDGDDDRGYLTELEGSYSIKDIFQYVDSFDKENERCLEYYLMNLQEKMTKERDNQLDLADLDTIDCIYMTGFTIDMFKLDNRLFNRYLKMHSNNFTGIKRGASYCKDHEVISTISGREYEGGRKYIRGNKLVEMLRCIGFCIVYLERHKVPIYPEQYIANSNIIHEESLKEYYDHFHPLEDLYRYIFEGSKISWKSTYGDINLNKEISMEIYTTRWGHYDNYRIKRTLDGWGISGLHSGNVKCAKDGEGALTDLLKHDSVCYPEEGLKYAMELLWNEADSTEMKMEELRRKISDIAEWINEVEKVTHQYQPEWCNYY